LFTATSDASLLKIQRVTALGGLVRPLLYWKR
jgi:hypothetical protein